MQHSCNYGVHVEYEEGPLLRRADRVVSGDVEVRAGLSAGEISFRVISCIAGIAAALSMAACAGGGGSSPMPSGSPVTENINSGMGSSSNSGSTGNSGTSTGTTTANTSTATSVGIPAPASFGPSPLPAQFATPAGPTLNGSNGIFPAVNTAFPVLSTTLQVTSNGLSPVANQGATSTVVSSSAASAIYQISVPSVGVSATAQISPELPTNVLSYVALGAWQQSTSGALTSYTEYVFGYETPPTSMPTTGTASFTGTAQGTVFTPGTSFVGTGVNGVAALSVNFASGNITGAFTQMQYVNPANPGSSAAPNYLPWNDVSVNANIGAGTSQFSGSTAVTSTPQSPLSMKASATGHINGGFYGPSAQALGGIWSLSDGTNSVLGTVLANH